MTDTSADSDGAERASNSAVRAALGTGLGTGLGALLGTSSVAAQDGGQQGGDAGNQTGQQDGGDELQADPGEQYPHEGLMLFHEFEKQRVFEVVSPPLPDAPDVAPSSELQGFEVRTISYLNGNDEQFLFVDPRLDLERGQLYVTGDEYTPVSEGSAGVELVEVPFRRLEPDETPLDLGPTANVPFLDGGGEAAVRPSNFHAGALFRVTDGPHGWLPEDVRQSGVFTDYDAYTARYLGANQRFLLFPQEGAAIEPGRLYVLFDEFEFFGPAGNLVAARFRRVDEGALEVDDEFLRED